MFWYTRFIVISALILLLFPTTATAQNPSVAGSVSVDWKEHEAILFDDVMVYPGESVTIGFSGKVNLDHHYFRVRRCKWAGLKCWYENRERANWVPASSLGIRMELSGFDPSFHIVNNEWVGGSYSGKTSFQNGQKITLTLGSSTNFEVPSFPRGVKIKAYLPNKAEGNNFTRTPCRGRPRYCSAGSVKVNITSESTSRLENLDKFVKAGISNRSIDVSVISSASVLDHLLVRPPNLNKTAANSRINNIVNLILPELEPYILSGEDYEASKYIEIIRFLLSLEPTDPNLISALQNAILKGQLNMGDFAGAAIQAPRVLQAASENYDPNDPTVKSTCLYINALKLNASYWRGKEVENSSEDLSVAVSFLDQSISAGILLSEKIMNGDVTVTASDECELGNLASETSPEIVLNDLLSEVAVDAARMMNLVRTQYGLEQSENYLQWALCLKTGNGDSGCTSKNLQYTQWLQSRSKA